MPGAETKKKRAGQRGKSIEEVVEYAISHQTRARVLSLLNEGSYTPTQISEILDVPLEKLSHHIRELSDGGSIEVAKVTKVGNIDQHYYRAVEMPVYSEEEALAMHPLQQQVTVGLIVQNIMAEVMAALWAGKLRDPQSCLMWRWFNVDAQGRADITAEQERFWERMQEIEAEATSRRISSGEEATSVIVAELGFERERKAPSPSADA